MVLKFEFTTDFNLQAYYSEYYYTTVASSSSSTVQESERIQYTTRLGTPVRTVGGTSRVTPEQLSADTLSAQSPATNHQGNKPVGGMKYFYQCHTGLLIWMWGAVLSRL